MRWPLTRNNLSNVVLRAHDPVRARRWWLAIALIWLASVVGAWLWASYHAAPRLLAIETALGDRATEVKQLKQKVEDLRRRLSISEKSDQVSRTANESLQATLRQHEEEIASLRGDIAFYQRLMDGKSGRKGLTVQALGVKAMNGGQGYNLRATLTQNLRKGEVSKGACDVFVEGMQGGTIVTLSWAELPGREPTSAPPFSFKYFQQVQAGFVLPKNFAPNRIKFVARSELGEVSEQTLAWTEAIHNGDSNDVWK